MNSSWGCLFCTNIFYFRSNILLHDQTLAPSRLSKHTAPVTKMADMFASLQSNAMDGINFSYPANMGFFNPQIPIYGGKSGIYRLYWVVRGFSPANHVVQISLAIRFTRATPLERTSCRISFQWISSIETKLKDHLTSLKVTLQRKQAELCMSRQIFLIHRILLHKLPIDWFRFPKLSMHAIIK